MTCGIVKVQVLFEFAEFGWLKILSMHVQVLLRQIGVECSHDDEWQSRMECRKVVISAGKTLLNVGERLQSSRCNLTVHLQAPWLINRQRKKAKTACTHCAMGKTQYQKLWMILHVP